MATTTGDVWGNMFETGDTVMTNKGQKPASKLKKCAKCDNTVKEDQEACTQCFSSLNEAKDILLD